MSIGRWIVIGSLLCATASCKGDSKGAALPPASGPGAAPRPELPKLDKPEAQAAQAAEVTDETTGTTYPKARAEVAPNMSGVIASIAVKEGDKVAKGQLLFRLENRDMALRVQQAQAGLKSAEVGLASVKVEYDRTQRLLDKKAIDQASWDRVQAQYDSALAGVNQAKVGVSLAREGLSDATVKSPIAGVVTAKLKNDGEMATMMPPSVVVVIEDHSVLELRFRLPERSLRALTVGDTVRAHFSSVGLDRDAKVVRLSPSVDARTRTFEVICEIENADGSLKSGMLATIKMRGETTAAPAPDTTKTPTPEAAPKQETAATEVPR
jgi:RND family efflux transporter MFP subunit